MPWPSCGDKLQPFLKLHHSIEVKGYCQATICLMQGEEPPMEINRRLGLATSRYGRSGEEKNLRPSYEYSPD
jgi:hypothetical protein